jgi:hypothetical protein
MKKKYPTTLMTTNYPTISPFGIDGNTHTPPVTIYSHLSLPMFLSPFDIKGRGYLSLGLLPCIYASNISLSAPLTSWEKG